MQRTARFALVLAGLLGLGIALWWWWTAAHHHGSDGLELYGNVDLRQVDLPFNGSERVAEVLVQEGDRVKRGQVLARLDTSRLIRRAPMSRRPGPMRSIPARNTIDCVPCRTAPQDVR
jgi:HlyD family secretion protein